MGGLLIILKSVLPQHYGGMESTRAVICMLLTAATDDRLKLAPCHDEFLGSLPRTVDQVASELLTKNY
ncbi:hypothetical protein TNCV_4471741 [Trichonephila clavipes]|uniref:Uncharacterized protein n=1 Tax=Trichonephila clavipes TaxID=2585209 RepID=A0A8X6SGU0_TRICX|nr:hypothetical protein TNCV_4471741 [Trichonephila clavipes]